MAFQRPGEFFKFGPGGYWSHRKDAWTGANLGIRRGRDSFTSQNPRLGAVNPNINKQVQAEQGAGSSNSSSNSCTCLPWWLIPLAALGLVETTVVLATKK